MTLTDITDRGLRAADKAIHRSPQRGGHAYLEVTFRVIRPTKLMYDLLTPADRVALRERWEFIEAKRRAA